MGIFTEQIVSDYIAADLETTGLSPDNDEIIEIAAVKVKEGQITDTFSSLVNPGRHISSMITEITGISDSMVAGAPSVREVMPEFLDFVGDLPLLGHNLIRFDMKFLTRISPVSNFCIDTLNLARYIRTGSKGCSLSALCSHLSIGNENAHRALSDCMATHELYEKLKKLYAQDGAHINMSLSCSKKQYQENIAAFCEEGSELTYSYDERGTLIFCADGKPVGTLPHGKQCEFEDNIPLIQHIRTDKISTGAKGKLLMSAEIMISG